MTAVERDYGYGRKSVAQYVHLIYKLSSRILKTLLGQLSDVLSGAGTTRLKVS